jgi:hypothetical protein
MALQTRVLAGGDPHLEFDWDDQTLYLRAIRCVNNTGQDAYVWAQSTSNGRTYESTVGQGLTEVSVGAQQAQRLQLSTTPSGKLDGVEWEFRFPA